jgi:hypothetical protein
VNLKAYHISPIKNRESILKNGLIPHEKDSGRIQYDPRIFFSTNDQDLGFDYVGYEHVDCWQFEVNSNSIKKDPFSGSSNHFFTMEPIGPSKIKLFSSH